MRKSKEIEIGIIMPAQKLDLNDAFVSLRIRIRKGMHPLKI